MKPGFRLIFLTLLFFCNIVLKAADYSKPFTITFQARETFTGKNILDISTDDYFNSFILSPNANDYIEKGKRGLETSKIISESAFYYCDTEKEGEEFGYFLINDPDRKNYQNPKLILSLADPVKVSKVFLEVKVLSMPDPTNCLYAGSSLGMSKPTQGVAVEPSDNYRFVELPFDNGDSDVSVSQIHFTQDTKVVYCLKSITIVPEGTDFIPPSEPVLPTEVELVFDGEEDNVFRMERSSESPYSFALPQIKSNPDRILSFDDFEFSVFSNNSTVATAVKNPGDSGSFILTTADSSDLEEGEYLITASLHEETGFSGTVMFTVEIIPSVKNLLFNGEKISNGQLNVMEYEGRTSSNVIVENIPFGASLSWKTVNILVDEDENLPMEEKIIPDEGFEKYSEEKGMDLSSGNLLYFILEKNGVMSDLHQVSYKNPETSKIEGLQIETRISGRIFTFDGLEVKDINNAPKGIYIKDKKIIIIK